MPRDNVVITGVGVVSAIGIGPEAFWEALGRGDSGIRSLGERVDGDIAPTDDDTIDGYWIGAPIIDFEGKKFVKPRKAMKVMCREIQTAFASAYLAIEDAGLSDQIPAGENTIAPERLGTVYGGEVFFNPPEELLETIKLCLEDNGDVVTGRLGDAARKEVMPLWMLKYLPNMPACQVGISINAQGPCNSLVLGDVSGPNSLIEAQSYLQRGLADTMLVGATGTRISGARITYRHDLPLPSRNGEAIESISRPHDPDATGVVCGEGAASLVVESSEAASARGAKPLASVLSAASRFAPTDAMRLQKRSGALDAEPTRGASKAIELAIRAVLDEADVDPSAVGLVVSHASGDPQVDAGEAKALADCNIDCPLVAVMASIGHTGAASGMIGVATGAIAMAKQMVPPTRHRQVENVRFASEPKPLASPYILCLSHTTDGSATAVLLGE